MDQLLHHNQRRLHDQIYNQRRLHDRLVQEDAVNQVMRMQTENSMTMMPVERDVTQRRYLVAELHEGWSYDQRQRQFQCKEEKIPLRDVLPRNTRVEFLAPDLVARPLSGLSRDERALASTLNIFLPEPENPDDFLDAIQGLDCVDKAWISPEVGLPGV